MTAARRTATAGILALATAATACPAMAMPVGTPSVQSDIVRVSSWASRAQGKSHTYAEAYGYGYGYDGGYARPSYGALGGPVYGAPYGYRPAPPPAYGYEGFDAY